MKHTELAAWLEEHKETLIAPGGEEEAADRALLEHVLEAARTGRANHLDAAIRQAARQAVTHEMPLDRLLRQPRRLREATWKAFKAADLPAERTLALIEAAEPIFARLSQTAAQAYFEATQQMQDALASEIVRLHSEAERRVMDRTAELTRANVELSKLEQARTDFISIAAHELKTPLTLIQGYANMLSELDLGASGAAGAAHTLAGIVRGIERLSAIVEDMLDVSVIDTNALSLRMEWVSLQQVVNLVVSQNAHHFQERKLAVHVEDLSGLPCV